MVIVFRRESNPQGLRLRWDDPPAFPTSQVLSSLEPLSKVDGLFLILDGPSWDFKEDDIRQLQQHLPKLHNLRVQVSDDTHDSFTALVTALIAGMTELQTLEVCTEQDHGQLRGPVEEALRAMTVGRARSGLRLLIRAAGSVSLEQLQRGGKTTPPTHWKEYLDDTVVSLEM